MNYFLTSFAAAWKLLTTFDPEVYFVVWTSLKIASVSALLAAVAGIPLGLGLALARFRGRGFLLLLLNTAMALPTVVIGLFVYALISRRGPLGELGLLFTPTGVIIGQLLLALPVAVHYAHSAIQALDPRLFLTIRTLGARGSAAAWKILTEARFGVMAAVVASFGRTIAEVGVAMMLGGNIEGFTRTMTTAIALETSKGEFELALALGLVLMAVAFTVNLGLYVLQRGSR
ncbi:MAG: ABC transporter permease [Deferrisomatales bacterium]|nr:ABC transporter permease [Deferrisomatales bacterium]